MKKMLLTVVLLATIILPIARADDFAVTNPAFRLDGNNVNLNFNIAGIPAAQRDVKIMFCDCMLFSENSIIQNQADWYIGSEENKTTVKAMIQNGWYIQSVFNLNAKQFFLVFIK